MNIDQAIKKFDEGESRKFSNADIDKIHRVVDELGLTQFDIKHKASGRRLIHDVSDLVRIQPSMIVFRRPSPGAKTRETASDPAWPYFIPLERWIEKGKRR